MSRQAAWITCSEINRSSGPLGFNSSRSSSANEANSAARAGRFVDLAFDSFLVFCQGVAARSFFVETHSYIQAPQGAYHVVGIGRSPIADDRHTSGRQHNRVLEAPETHNIENLPGKATKRPEISRDGAFDPVVASPSVRHFPSDEHAIDDVLDPLGEGPSRLRKSIDRSRYSGRGSRGPPHNPAGPGPGRSSDIGRPRESPGGSDRLGPGVVAEGPGVVAEVSGERPPTSGVGETPSEDAVGAGHVRWVTKDRPDVLLGPGDPSSPTWQRGSPPPGVGETSRKMPSRPAMCDG